MSEDSPRTQSPARGLVDGSAVDVKFHTQWLWRGFCRPTDLRVKGSAAESFVSVKSFAAAHCGRKCA